MSPGPAFSVFNLFFVRRLSLAGYGLQGGRGLPDWHQADTGSYLVTADSRIYAVASSLIGADIDLRGLRSQSRPWSVR